MSYLKRIIAFFLFLGVIHCSFSQDQPRQQIVFHTLNDEHIPFSALKNKWLLINYWASWCPSCLEEINELNHFYHANKNKIVLFGVNYDGVSTSEQTALIKKYNIFYPNLRKDPTADLGLDAIAGVPVTFIFNPQGHLVKAIYGKQTQRSLSKELRIADENR